VNRIDKLTDDVLAYLDRTPRESLIRCPLCAAPWGWHGVNGVCPPDPGRDNMMRAGNVEDADYDDSEY